MLGVGFARRAPRRFELGRLDVGQALFLVAQALAARLGLFLALLDAARLGRQHLDLLLHRRDRVALLVAARLRRAQGVLARGEASGVRGEVGGDRLGATLGGLGVAAEPLMLGARLALANSPGGALRLEIGALAQQSLAARGDVADPLLEPTHFERRLAELALRRMERIVGIVVRLADRLELGLGATQVGAARLERGRRRDHRLADTLFLARRVAVLEEPELVLLDLRLVLHRPIAAGDLGLRLELLEVAGELAQDVLDPDQVLARVLESRLGLAPALLVLRHAGRLLEEQAQLLGLALDDPRDRSLADDRVGARAEASAEEDVLDVAPAHRLAVDVIAARAVARQHALDGDLGEAVPGPAGAAFGVVERELDAGAAGGLAQVRAVEDHVLHRLAAQLARLAFAEDPAHRVDDVRLAAAVGADDADELAGKLEMGRLDERLEARQLDRIETHGRGRLGLPKLLI